MKSLSDQPKGTHGDDKSQADKLVELATKGGAQFFHDQFQRSHVRILIEEHLENLALSQQGFQELVGERVLV